MLKFFSWFKIKERPELRDARTLYQKLMVQSRLSVFYTKDGIKDNYDGRMEWLCMHLALVLQALRQHGTDGSRLSQSLYDVMVDDFDVALREEGLSDTGVSRRIKPLAKMFFTRAKSYHEAIEEGNKDKDGLEQAAERHIFPVLNNPTKSGPAFTAYVQNFAAILEDIELDALSRAEFPFPKLT